MQLPSSVRITSVTSNSQTIPYVVSGSSVKIYHGNLSSNQSVVYSVSMIYNGSNDDNDSLSIVSKVMSTMTDPSTTNNQATSQFSLTKNGTSVGDKVWFDTDRNGIQGPGETNAA